MCTWGSPNEVSFRIADKGFRHRRIRFADVLAYRDRQDAKSREAYWSNEIRRRKPLLTIRCVRSYHPAELACWAYGFTFPVHAG